MNHNPTILGLDIGQARIGVARASTVAKIAEPLMTLTADNALTELQKLSKELSVQTVVAGLPRGLDGQETNQTRTVRQWVAEAKNELQLPFFWQDEALTSQAVEADQAKRQKTDNAGPDAAAAAIILQDFLNAPEEQRTVA